MYQSLVCCFFVESYQKFHEGVILSTFFFHIVVTSFCIMKPPSCQVYDLSAKYITLSEFNMETWLDSGDLQHLVKSIFCTCCCSSVVPPSVRVACDHISVFFQDEKVYYLVACCIVSFASYKLLSNLQFWQQGLTYDSRIPTEVQICTDRRRTCFMP